MPSCSQFIDHPNDAKSGRGSLPGAARNTILIAFDATQRSSRLAGGLPLLVVSNVICRHRARRQCNRCARVQQNRADFRVAGSDDRTRRAHEPARGDGAVRQQPQADDYCRRRDGRDPRAQRRTRPSDARRRRAGVARSLKRLGISRLTALAAVAGRARCLTLDSACHKPSCLPVIDPICSG
jgi:hypothetical protein